MELISSHSPCDNSTLATQCTEPLYGGLSNFLLRASRNPLVGKGKAVRWPWCKLRQARVSQQVV